MFFFFFFFQKVHFITKNSFAHYIFNGNLGLFVALMEAELQQLLCRVVFGRFWALTGTWALMSRGKLQSRRK